MQIEKIAVIGAGVMGGSIAAHMANAGKQVVLLDIVPKDASNKNIVAESAIQKLLKMNPAPFMHKSFAKRIQTGNLEDHLDYLSDCDWIIEAVIEDLDIKTDLYKKIDTTRKKGSIISSNTSTIPLSMLVEKQSDAFQQDFLITHFFNPPRYMRLLELVKGTKTKAEHMKVIEAFCDIELGKGCVQCFDSPGFIANRIGTFWIQTAMINAMDQGITVEEADAVLGRPMGVPKTGVFALVDLVGLDLMPHISKSLLSTLPKDDAYCKTYRDVDLFKKMIADGYTGRKGKGGFYRLDPEAKGKKVKQAIDLKTGDYHDAARPSIPLIKTARKLGLPHLLGDQGKIGQYAWSVISQTLSYAANLVGEIAESVYDIDQAMKLGYNWKMGPFELIDKIGVAWFRDRLLKSDMAVPKILSDIGDQTFYKIEDGKQFFFGLDGKYHAIERPIGVELLSDIKLTKEPLEKNASASLWDVGDDIVCLEFTSKMNALDEEIMTMIAKAVKLVGSDKTAYKALVVHNEGTHFSAGANLGLALFALNLGMWMQVEEIVAGGQRAYHKLKYAPFPVIAAPSGMAIGGGCEILLHCDAVMAHAESYIGLVETGVGLIPGWGGCKEMLARYANDPKRAKGPMPAVSGVFEMVATAQVAKSAYEAFDMLYLRRGIDEVVMNKDRLLFKAKEKALEMAKTYEVPTPHEYKLPGSTGRTALNMAVDGFVKRGLATPHDVTVGGKLAYVLSGGKTDHLETLTEKDILKLEVSTFMELVKTAPTLDRIEHMLTTGKPLRN